MNEVAVFKYETESQVIPPQEEPKWFSIKVEDDSMYPIMAIGDDVCFERGCVGSGDVAVFVNIKTQETIVRKTEYIDGEWSMIPRNSDYPEITGKDINDWYAFGKVLWCGRKIAD